MNHQRAQMRSWKLIGQNLFLLGLIAISAGTASAGFLWALDEVTRQRFSNPWWLWALPLLGWAMAWIYQKVGSRAKSGTEHLLAEVCEPEHGVPRRMAPMILLGTLLTHLGGGSAGREGTALQMGGGIAAWWLKAVPAAQAHSRMFWLAGMAAGFGGVFGTPVAAAIFSWEMVRRREISKWHMLPCLAAAVVAHLVCEAWGMTHVHYSIAEFSLSAGLIAKIILLAILCGLLSRAFVMSSRAVTSCFAAWIPRPEWRAFAGGLAVIALVALFGTRDFLGLGILAEHAGATTLPACFTSQEIPQTAWLMKWLFTVVTLSAGFKGGEVTPLFFMGAAFGNAVAMWLGAPISLCAAVGWIALFAAATRAPLAAAVMGMELFGLQHAGIFLTACVLAILISGKATIYQIPDGRPH